MDRESRQRDQAPLDGATLTGVEGHLPRLPLIVIGVMALITLVLFSWWLVQGDAVRGSVPAEGGAVARAHQIDLLFPGN